MSTATEYIREFCQVSLGPLPRFACGPGISIDLDKNRLEKFLV